VSVKSDDFLIGLFSVLTLLVGGALLYVLYVAHPNDPIFNVQEEGYKTSLLVENLTNINKPVEVLRDGVFVKTIENSEDLFLEYLSPGTYTYTVQYTAQNMLGMSKRMEKKIPLIVSEISKKELSKYYDFPKISFTNQGYSVYISFPDLKTFSQFSIFEDGQLIKTITKEEATTTIPLGYFSSGVHSFEIVFIDDTIKILDDFLRQDYDVDVGAIATLREEGYKVFVTIQNLEGITSPVIISRDGNKIKSFRSKGEYVLEYIKPGEYDYGIGYNIRDDFGKDKKLEVTKHLSVGDYTREELAQYYDFPNIDFIAENYGVYASSTDIRAFSEIKVFENENLINTITLRNGKKTLLENLPLGKHSLEVVFVSKETKKVEDLLRKGYEVEVVPIPPVIDSVLLTPFAFKQGYSSEVTMKVHNAATCTADLILQSLKDSTTTEPLVLKSYSFRGGEGFDYFSPHTEKWSWDEIFFPIPLGTSTVEYNVNVKVTCNDYYNETSAEAEKRMQIDNLVSEDSIALTYKDDLDGIVKGELLNNVENDFICTFLANDAGALLVDEEEFSLLGLQTHEFDMNKYEEDFLSVTVTCEDKVGNHVVKNSWFHKEGVSSIEEKIIAESETTIFLDY